MELFKNNKYICIHYLLGSTILLISLIIGINVAKPLNLIVLSVGLILVFLYGLSTIFFSKRVPFFEIGFLFTGGIVILLEQSHFEYAYFISAIAIVILVLETIVFSFKKNNNLPYGVLHAKLYAFYKISLAVVISLIGYGYTKIETYVWYSVLSMLGIVFVILVFYLYEWLYYEKQRKSIYLGKPIVKIMNYDYYHRQTTAMIHLLNSQFYLVNGKYYESITEFDKITEINFHERLEYNRVYITLTALLSGDYEKTLKALEESKKYTRFYKGKKAKRYVGNLMDEFKKYIDIYFNKSIKYDLVPSKKKDIYLMHFLFFSVLYYKKNKNEKKSQEYWTLLSQKRSLPIETDILNH